ncbi:glycosyltransferase [Thermotoga sp. KOL6]|uniref:glycosyltransferase n=1 Tax=Thermotoga sp. KOL6 TaxID=126741 RepID=UPI000C76DF97|nr:glycosyltransferase [Thermotoga sp. KOL6]PLV59320.1 glycosyl transferase family 1 [Thermotoga sp. KOL6]
MKVLIIGYTHSKNDKRVFRTVQALSKRCRVIYQYLTEKKEHPIEEGNIEYLPVCYIREENLLKKFFKRRNFDKMICKLVAEEDYDILYMHHFPATKPIEPFKIAKKRGKKIIYDVHEHHPQNFLGNLPVPLRWIKEQVMWWVFKRQIAFSDRCIFVSKEIADDVFKTIGLEKPHLVVPNYASVSMDPEKKEDEICFVGKTFRSLSTEEIQILKELAKDGIRFKVIGMNTNFGIENSKVLPFLPYEEMMKEVSKAKFSWISFQTVVKSDRYKNDIFSLPHKFFDSIAAGTPVVVNKRFVSMAKIVEEKKVGIVIDPKNVKESVEKIRKAFLNYGEIMESLKKHQRAFVWDEEKEERFLDFVLT